MEFKFDLTRFCKPNKEGLLVLLPQPTHRSPQISEIIDSMGRASSIAQGLPSTITTSSRFFNSSDNKLYLKIHANKVVGILKTGVRKLFYTNEIGRMLEITPLCLLDFYIHETCQRSGFGKELYEFMLKTECTTPNKLAIDKPSHKLLAFMRKYYSLSDFVSQNNNYVVYKQYFGGFNKEEIKVFEVNKRNSGHSQNYIRKGMNEGDFKNLGKQQQEESCRKIYVAVPPWAVSNSFSTLATSYSQYGAQVRK